jgi:hypothetical protein
MLPRLFGRRKKKDKELVTEKGLRDILGQELRDYIKQADLQGYIDSIERDRRKKQIWDSLSPRKKLKFLRYLAEKKGKTNAKKRK